MNFKTIIQFLTAKFFWKNILVAFAIFIFVVIATLVMLRFVTHHGEEVVVPDLRGMYVEEVEVALQNSSVGFEVVDSVYLRSKNKGEITEQLPAPDTKVKKGRKIYVTINAKTKKQVIIPAIQNTSYRQAKATLEALGFKVEITYKPAEYSNLVLDIKQNGVSLAMGAHAEDGSTIELVVGKNESDLQVVVASYLGLNYAEAVAAVATNSLILGIVDFDEEPESEEAKNDFFVYEQSPQVSEICAAGKRIDLKLSRNKDKKSTNSATQHDEFF